MAKLDLPALKAYVHNSFNEERAKLGREGTYRLLDEGKKWDLAPTLRSGGTVLFPHANIEVCGYQIAATVHACLNSGADRVLVVGVLHALTDELQDARVRVANGADVTKEKYWGIQGPELGGFDNWESEFSLSNFLYLWEMQAARRGGRTPELILRYPYLAGGKPEILPGIRELEDIVKRGAVVVTTADVFHHGIGYGETAETALYPERGGLDLARKRITEGIRILERGDYWAYNQHCVDAKSDGRDAGQVVRYLLGPLKGNLLDLTSCDTTDMYNTPPPTWVACALIEYQKPGP